jgi:hypothetical protein
MLRFVVLFSLLLSCNSFAQRSAVSAKEVSGTFRSKFTGSRLYNEVRILALGGNKLYVEFDFVRPKGEGDANFGWTRGFAWIIGDSAVFRESNDWVDQSPAVRKGEDCVITLKFSKPGEVLVDDWFDDGNDGCGFGLGVSGEGIYKKVSSSKPRFHQPENISQRRAVSKEELTGTFAEITKYTSDTIRIAFKNDTTLEVEFHAFYPRSNVTEKLIGEARIIGDIAVFREQINKDADPCRIILKFVKPGLLMVTNVTMSRDCNINVSWGEYAKVKPSLKRN